MATYYVRPDGNNSNTGTGPAANQAWQTLARIVQAGTAFTSGDTVYIAPGTYRQSITTTATYTSATNFFGDPTAAQFPGVTPGIVRITNFLSTDNVAATNQLLWGGVTFNHINISNINFDHSSLNGGIYYTGTSNNSSIKNCVFSGNKNTTGGLGIPCIRLTAAKNLLIENCIFQQSYFGVIVDTTTDTNTNVTIRNCTLFNMSGVGIYITNSTGGGIFVTNNILCTPASTSVILTGAGNATSISYVTNNIFYQCSGSVQGGSSTNILENYNRRINSGGNTTVLTGINTITDGAPQFDFGHSALFNIALQKPFSSITGSVNVGAGLSTYASTTDLYGQTWSAGASLPDIGCATAVQASGTSYYYPTDRNASTITIAPGSTSQSIELYLGVTGLTASTSGLSARYNRTRTASVSIPLVARTIAQAWTSGGFAEVDATNMPGVYRLDIPNEAVDVGADDVTVVVRGASGTNGAVMTVKLSSGGLTEAQTASAVWGAQVAGYNTALDFGGVINETRNVVGATETYVQGVASDVWDELKVNHTIPNTFGDYLDTKVSTGADTARIQLRQGPFLIKQNAIDSVITEVNQFLSTVPNIEMVLIDSSGGSVSVAGATLVMRVRNQAGTAVVNNITPTVAYADGGVIRWSPNLSWNALTVTTAGTYRIVVERTMSGVTTTFGPFLVQLSSG